jgi:acyl-CoA reductase-like NAD-dependent aldehyde dehydrogenase
MNKPRQLSSLISGVAQQSETELSVLNPFSNSVVATIQQLTSSELLNIEVLSKISDERIHQLFGQLATWLRNSQIELSQIAAAETGSPVSYQSKDIDAVIEFLSESSSYIKNRQKKFAWQPKGRLALFLSANEPIILGVLPVLSGLLAGNQVWVKPSSKTPSIPYLIVSQLLQMGFPKDRLHLLFPTRELTKQLLSEGFFNTVLSFGNFSTNCALAAMAVSAGTEFIGENEGNDWVYIDSSYADSLSDLSNILYRSFTKHNGQLCDGVRGILVDQSIYPTIVSELKKIVSKTKPSDPQKIATQVGALLTGSAETISSMIEKVRPDSKEIFNFTRSDNRVSPTIVVEPNETADIITTGLFGPVVWIRPVNSVGDAIKLHKKYNPYGLGFSIFSNNSATIDQLTSELTVSRININVDPVEISIFSPWGGVAKSGHGGPLSWLEKLSNRKLINNGQY